MRYGRPILWTETSLSATSTDTQRTPPTCTALICINLYCRLVQISFRIMYTSFDMDTDYWHNYRDDSVVPGERRGEAVGSGAISRGDRPRWVDNVW